MAKKRATPIITDFDNIPADALVPKDEQPYEIPSHWKWVRLGAVLHGMETRKPSGDFFMYLDIDSVDNALQEIREPRHVQTSKAPSRASRAVHAGATLFSMVRPYLRNIALIEDDLAEAVASTGFYVCRPIDVVDSVFLFEYLRSEVFIDLMTTKMRGDNSPSIRADDLREAAFALPPIDEQKAIVDKLQATNQKIDAVLERLDQFLDQAPQQRAAIIQAGVTGALTKAWREEHGRTMDTWLNTTVQGLGQVVTGGTPPTKDPSNYGPGIAFVKPTDLNQGRHVVGAEATLSAVGAERSRVLPPNSVAMCCIGATITKAGLIEVESATNQQINAVVPNDDSDPVFVYYLFESQMFKQQVLDSSSATTLPIINKGRFSKLPLSVPPKTEQVEIATRMDAAMASAGRAVEAAKIAKTQLERTKSVVRMRALRGLT